MARWEPGTRDRLAAAALDLVAAQGFDATSTAQIAAAAGLSERTFFRHFDDKREALFAGSELFEASFVDAIAAAPVEASPFEMVTVALDGAAEFFDRGRRAHAVRRAAVIAGHSALRERELLKLAALARTVAGALREHGVPDPDAALAAESCVTVFRIAFERWLRNDEARDLADIQTEVLAGLRTLAAPRAT